MMPGDAMSGADLSSTPAPSPTRVKPWLRQGVTRQHAVIATGIAALVWLSAVGALTVWLHETVQGQANIKHQSLNVRLPDLMLANADIQSHLQTVVDTTFNLNLPIHQQLVVDLPPTVTGQSHVNVDIPVNTQVVHAFVLKLMAPIDTHVSIAAWLPDVHVKFELPLSIPVEMNVPVRASVPLSLKLQANAKLPDTLQVPIHSSFKLDVPIRQALNMRAVSRTSFALHDTKADIPIHLTQTQLSMPLSGMALHPTRLTNDSKASSSIHSTTDRQIKPTALRK
jgi:hypothetical protein